MADAKPDWAVCVHTNLDASAGSAITALAMQERQQPFAYVKVSSAGAVLEVEWR
jgi:hypothetical protein